MPPLYDSLPTKSGIYKIESLVSGECYVGSSTNIRERAQKHLYEFKNNKNSLILQRAWNKYGEKNIVMMVIELCDRNILRKREQYYIDTLHPKYNLSRLASGLEMTPEIRKKVSDGLRKRFTPEELRERVVRMQNSRSVGFFNKPEYKDKLRESTKSLWKTSEYRSKVLSSVHGNFKLSKTDVDEIRKRYVPGNGKQLAKEFGVSQPTISAIICKRNWK